MAKPTYLLAINAGSSSLKTSLYSISTVGNDSSQSYKLLIQAGISGLFSSPKLTYDNISSKSISNKQDIKDAKIEIEKDAFEYILKKLKEDALFRMDKDMNSIRYVCHRVVHGGGVGEKGPAVLGENVEENLKKITSLAPLHNGPAISIIDACRSSLSHAKNIAFFDTTFHNNMPEYVKTYAIDQKVAKENGLRKYGFHGLSYSFITRESAKLLGKNVEETSLIALHLGSGSSICAIKDGKSIDTSMGLTPLEGLPSGSRSGSIDPSLVFHFTSHPTTSDKVSSSTHTTHSEALLNKSSGFKALTGTTDFSSILSKYSSEDNCRLAVDIFLDRILGYIGSYWLKLGGGKGGVDAIVFAGGIGESSAEFRKMVEEGMRKGLGDVVSIDNEKNEKTDSGRGDKNVLDVSGNHQGTKVLVCWTDEQEEMVNEFSQKQELSS